jgi:hypothetical protein
MDPTLRTRADARLGEALSRDALEDPRARFRDRLRFLRERDPSAFEEAIRYYEETLVPRVAADADPIEEWFEYGRRLADLTGPGIVVSIDAGGRAATFQPPVPRDHLVLHIPDDAATPVLVLVLPLRLTPPQRATYDLLVAGKVQISNDGEPV